MRRWNKKRKAFAMILAILSLIGTILGTKPMPADASVFPFMAEAEITHQELSLYAAGAVLMDADTGRVLYGKNEEQTMAMASTTKIMTCIVALEEMDIEEECEVSAYAASMPKVKLGVVKGESYQIKDLLYSLMLESHNDSAVVIAENYGRKKLNEERGENKRVSDSTKEESREAVAVFAAKMNEKARSLGCVKTCFITPNGLDATMEITDENGNVIEQCHETTAEELAKIMAYCAFHAKKTEEFLQITRTSSYSFQSNGGRSFSCNNHNAFLNMMEGAVSGKTGFTNKAGYCYVGALERDGKRLTVALLACGWPNNKGYKWIDTKNLMNYGLSHYQIQNFLPEISLSPVWVKEGIKEGNPYEKAWTEVVSKEKLPQVSMLLTEGEKLSVKTEYQKSVQAPVKKGEKAGSISYILTDKNGEESVVLEKELIWGEDVKKVEFKDIFAFVLHGYFQL